MSTDDDKKDKDPVPAGFADLVTESPPVILSDAERERGGVEGPIADEPLPPLAPTTATFGDLQAAVGVTPTAAMSTSVSGSIASIPSPSPSASASASASPSSASRLPSPPPAPASRRPSAGTFSDADDADADDSDETATKKRKWPIVVGLSALLGAVIAAFVLLGNANSQRYYLRCSAKYITAEQGNSFPPWGTERVSAPGFKPISIPPNAECTPQATDSLVKLEDLYLAALVDQATRKLSGTQPGDIDAAQAELEQALLLTRSPERRDQRKDLERLLGDVTYWRAAAKVKSAASALEDAAKRFDEAAAARPRHASDASEWARFARETAGALSSGPSGAGAPQSPPSGVPLPGARPTAPPGVALPIEMPPPGTASDAGVEDIDAARSNLPSGGVLM